MSRLSVLRGKLSHSTHTFSEADVKRDAEGRFAPKDAANLIAMKIKNKKTGNFSEVTGKSSEAKNLLSDINKLKLLSLSTPLAYKAAVGQLQRKYKNSPFTLVLINTLGLERGVSNKSDAANKLQELEKLLSTNKVRKSALKHKLSNIELSPIEISPDHELEKLKNRILKPKDKAALDAILKYRESIKDLNGVMTATHDNLTDIDYNHLFDKKEKTWKSLKDALDASQGLKNDYLSEPILDKYIETMCKISRESPGGYKIVLPSSMEQINEKVKASPC